MQFKEPHYLGQLNDSPKKLQEIAQYFDELSHQFGIDPVCTRVWDGVPGDSGVHEAHRGIDFRDEVRSENGPGHYLYTPEQINYILVTINNMYPRHDGHLTCLHHSMNGGPAHFHIQIPATWIDA